MRVAARLWARAHLKPPLAVVAHVKAECGVELGLQGLRATVHAGTLTRLRARRLWARWWLWREPRGTAPLELCHRLRRLVVERILVGTIVHAEFCQKSCKS